MTIQGSYQFKTVKALYREREILHFDHIVQRDYAWDDYNASMFIHSLLYGYPYPPVYAITDDKDHLWFLDGKQRLERTVFNFIDGQFKLTRNVPPFKGVKLSGLTFSELPEDFQDIIYSSMFQVYQYRNLTYVEIRELFSRLNSAVALSKFEKVRIWVPEDVAEVVRDIKGRPFFDKSINMGKAAKKRKMDEEVIFQILLVLRNHKEATELVTKTVRRVIMEMAENSIQPEMIKELRATTDYLGEAFPNQMHQLSKVHILSIFITATYAVEEKLPPEKFGLWATGFFQRHSGINTPYGYASMLGQANKVNVQKRLNEMKKDYDTFKNREPKAPVEVR